MTSRGFRAVRRGAVDRGRRLRPRPEARPLAKSSLVRRSPRARVADRAPAGIDDTERPRSRVHSSQRPSSCSATPPRAVLAAVATALAVGTKIPATYGVPILVAVAVVPPNVHRLQRVAAVLAGATAGSYWYLVNTVQTGDPLGELRTERARGHPGADDEPSRLVRTSPRRIRSFGRRGHRHPRLRPRRGRRCRRSAAELTRQPTRDQARGRRRVGDGSSVRAPRSALRTWRVFAKLHDILDAPDGSLPVTGWESQTVASESISWFGPLDSCWPSASAPRPSPRSGGEPCRLWRSSWRERRSHDSCSLR